MAEVMYLRNCTVLEDCIVHHVHQMYSVGRLCYALCVPNV